MLDKKIFLLILLLMSCMNICFPQHIDNSSIDCEKREEWIRITTNILRSFSPQKQSNNITLRSYQKNNNNHLSVRVQKEGLIQLGKNKWIFIKTNSSHDNPQIGDISLAIDNRRMVYINDSHICGGIIHFETQEINELKNSKEFFRYFVSDVERKKWKKLSNNK